MGLPEMVYGDGIAKHQTVQFGGYNHNLYAGDGQIWDEKNMSSDLAPLLAPRKPRYKIGTLTKPNGFYARDGHFWVDGTKFYADGVEKGTVTDTEKTICALGPRLIILPDKKYYNTLDGSFGSLENTQTAAVKIEDGTYAGEDAEANTIRITAEGGTWEGFNAGDAVTLSGASQHPSNNKTIIIREIDGDKLRFYENSFEIDEGGDTESALTVTRSMPDMDFICENENRLWGCKGDTIYACKPGDPFNWNVFDGLSADSYAIDVGSAGDFTACCSFLGYPIFFKEDIIYKVYGDKPSNYQVMSSASLGVAAGSHKSLAVAGEVLFYLSRAGIMAYSGGIPAPIGAAFGTQHFKNAVGGSDGRKYYVSMRDQAGVYQFFTYDTWTSLWHREDSTQAMSFCWDGDLLILKVNGEIWLVGNVREAPEGAVKEAAIQSYVEFGDFVEGDANKKGIAKLQIRLEVGANSTVTVQIKYDSVGTWETVSTITTDVKKSCYLPVIPHRADHFRIKITGIGEWTLYSLVRETYSGSELRSR